MSSCNMYVYCMSYACTDPEVNVPIHKEKILDTYVYSLVKNVKLLRTHCSISWIKTYTGIQCKVENNYEAPLLKFVTEPVCH